MHVNIFPILFEQFRVGVAQVRFVGVEVFFGTNLVQVGGVDQTKSVTSGIEPRKDLSRSQFSDLLHIVAGFRSLLERRYQEQSLLVV